MTTISIIIPLFNKSEYIENTLRLLIPQILEGDEIIVVDDFSSDDGCDIASKLIHTPSGKVIQLQNNCGPATARNIGAKVANGKYLLFFDADDIPSNDLLYYLRIAIKSLPDRDVYSYRISFGAHGEGAVSENSQSQAVLPIRLRKKHAFVSDSLSGRSLCTASSTCVKRESFIKVGGFSDGLRYCEDPELWARLSSQYEIVQIDKTLAIYRDVLNGLSYNQRIIPGSIDKYVNTLLELDVLHGGDYLSLAKSIICKNVVFSRWGGLPTLHLRTYIQSRRSIFSFSEYFLLVFISYIPTAFYRLALYVRKLINLLKSKIKFFFI